jgi:hypothetical protein
VFPEQLAEVLALNTTVVDFRSSEFGFVEKPDCKPFE